MPINYESLFLESIEQLKTEGRYRVFNNLERKAGSFPMAKSRITDRTVTVWCSNDYLGMGQHPKVISAMSEAIGRLGAGAGGTRNISGTHNAIVTLEQTLSELHNKEAALVFTSGYIANEATLATLCTMLKNCIVYSDVYNHASMIHGIRSSKVEKHIFRHNDAEHLESLLKQADPMRPKIIAFESVYSMDGDIAPIKVFCDLADKYNAITYLDEVHAVGMYGARGGGVAERDGVMDRVTIIQGTLGKALGGASGGFTSGRKEIIEMLRQRSRPYLFSNTLAPSITGASIAVLDLLSETTALRDKLEENTKYFREKMTALGFDIKPGEHPIVPIMLYDAVLSQTMATKLLDEGIYVIGFFFPVVPKGQARIRVQISAAHDMEHLDKAIAAFTKVGKELGVIK